MANAEFHLPSYRLGKTLGIGSFGKVKVAEHVLTGHKVAIKILNKKKIVSMDMEEKVRREIKILKLFMHPHIIRLYEVIETPGDIFVVMEYVKSGELFDYIVEKGRLLEDEARRFFQQILSGVEYCHRNMVVHRDLKPENLLLDSRNNIKIADFGLSNVMRDGHFLKTSCGSPNYAAPEVISGRLYGGPEVDVWSCGVILYALLCGSLPFDDENIPNLFKKIKGGIYTLPGHLSLGARDLIHRMLVVDPMKRVTIPEIRQHNWFQAKLPRYLAVPPPNAAEQAKQVDEDMVQLVVKMGFERYQLIESLRNRITTKATVAYYLLLDNRRRATAWSGYLGAEFSEPREHANMLMQQQQQQAFDPTASTARNPLAPLPTPGSRRGGSGGGVGMTVSLLGGTNHMGYPLSPTNLHHRVVADRKWALGLQSRAHPTEIMAEVYRALQALQVSWKKVPGGWLYLIRCRWDGPQAAIDGEGPYRGSLAQVARTQSYEEQEGLAAGVGVGDGVGVGVGVEVSRRGGLAGELETQAAEAPHMGVDIPQGGVKGDLSGNRMTRRPTVRMEMQLFKMKEDKFLLDVQQLSGSQMLFMDLCAAFLAELHVI